MKKSSLLKKIIRLTKPKNKLSKFEKSNRRFKQLYPDFSIGRGSYGLPTVHRTWTNETLKIGSFCSIASNVQIYLGGQHRSDWVTTSPLNIFFESNQKYNHETSKGDVIIGNDVWICGNAIILSGLTVGGGAVISNGAVVTRNVEPYSIVAGNPAKHIKYRSPPETIKSLLETKWWDWPEPFLRANIDKLLSKDIGAFITFAKSINSNRMFSTYD